VSISYNIAADISFGEASQMESGSQYFVYEADEFDRNFLAFKPFYSLITGIDWDHPDIYPSRDDYNQAFREFLANSDKYVIWDADAARLELPEAKNQIVLDDEDSQIDEQLRLIGRVNRLDAWIVAHAVQQITGKPFSELIEHLNNFPGLSRRFEQLVPGLYSDYAHTVPKIRGALNAAYEVAGDNVVVVYEGLHNTRQHFIKNELKHLFDGAKKIYIVPSYLAREDPSLPLLKPDDLKHLLDDIVQTRTEPAELSSTLYNSIKQHLAEKDLVICLSAGGGGSLDEWLRQNFKPRQQ
jgi:UDP-N-acetylmuramate--alanine ligase